MAADTGASDPTYNLVSVLYHALNGVETYDQYVADAERDADDDAAEYFRWTQQQLREVADRGKQLLQGRLGG